MSDTVIHMNRPRISELGIDLLRVTHWQLARSIALPLIAFASFWFFAAMEWWFLAVFSTVVLSFVTYGSTSHDLVHANLGLKRLPNDILLSVIEAISLRSGHAYRAAHLHHHASFPHADDIEADASRMSFIRALCEGVVFQFRIYYWAFRNSEQWRRWIAGEGIAVLAIVFGALAALPWTIAPIVYAALMIPAGETRRQEEQGRHAMNSSLRNVSAAS